MSARRVLIGGIGNVFWGDDAFGVEVARRLGARSLPYGVSVVDFGIRGFDLACALLDGYDAAILVDVVRRGGAPGTLYVIAPENVGPSLEVDGHGLDPARVLALARSMGSLPPIRLIGCEPLRFTDDGDPCSGLSDSVARAIDPAIALALDVAKHIGDRDGGIDA